MIPPSTNNVCPGTKLLPLPAKQHSLSKEKSIALKALRGELFIERVIQEGALQLRLEFGWWAILEEWERAYRTLVKYAGEKKNIDVEFLYSSESEGFRDSPFFDDVTGFLNLDSYWQNVGKPELLAAGI